MFQIAILGGDLKKAWGNPFKMVGYFLRVWGGNATLIQLLDDFMRGYIELVRLFKTGNLVHNKRRGAARATIFET
ncbi:hypothetical protein H0194_07915 [Corynebacterium incognita]|uniref:Uncharacterized protein n=1 Tax=Corynebacterium incognita TaxID=2754725 RepID=A0A7G7CN36_9CORY|nr:hypothetical protein [Corynebacterium incognita]QNE89002.1 hypothetical protein H0194_07915 [Corynebacterium incognita]